jgi:DNA (cytosine-5-)-methyltransferase
MTQANKHGSYNFIDLFAGAGGLSEGFIQAGFYPVAHVEMNEHAAKTLETRSAYYHLKSIDKLDFYRQYLSGRISRAEFTQMIPDSVTNTVINETLSNETIPYVFDTIDVIMRTRGIEKIDVIVGGPPCQAYSLVGRAQSSHMGTPMRDDPRNYLYKLYAQFLEKYQPRMFVFENVLGIASAQGGSIWKELQETLKQVGYEIECHAQNAQNFGVLQNRRRMIIVGWLKNSGLAYPDFVVKKANAIVNDLFTDLPKLYPGESNNNYSEEKPSQYVMETGIRTADDILTLQICRPNIARDITIYKRAIELWNKGHQRLNYNDLPEELKTHRNRHSFIDRFKVVEGDENCCHTVLAHLSKDGHYFIHPDIDQHRSITVREAARIQSFPDSYYFEGPRTSQFMQIGNAVPPLMARGIAEGVFSQLHGGVNGQ